MRFNKINLSMIRITYTYLSFSIYNIFEKNNSKANESISQKAKKIGNILDELYPKTPIPLEHSSAYTFAVAVMLSFKPQIKK